MMNGFLGSLYVKLLPAIVLVLLNKNVACFTIRPSTIFSCVSSNRPCQTLFTHRNVVHCKDQKYTINLINRDCHDSLCFRKHNALYRTTPLWSSYTDPENNNIFNGRDRAGIILYRTSLVVGSFACALNGITMNIEGLGLSVEMITNVEHLSNMVFTWGILCSALAIPNNQRGFRAKNAEGQQGEGEVDREVEFHAHPGVFDGDSTWPTFVNNALPYLSSLAIVIKLINETLSLSIMPTLDEVSNEFFISAVCLREIGYFGAPYKVEAILALGLVFISSLGLNEGIGFSDTILSSLLALCLLVLSFGKVFEPLKDDLHPNGSAFFRDNAM